MDSTSKRSMERVKMRKNLPSGDHRSRSEGLEPDPVDAADVFDGRHLQLRRLHRLGGHLLLVAAALVIAVVVSGVFGAAALDRVQVEHLGNEKEHHFVFSS